ncbi:recombinase family protein [Burkholderia ubonensis]|uniref:recombinase family protein n=1 Tax=Burkholderia ubonensis TaxID=101571 RepID=UPI000AA98E69|nr:recombinase family protein [Burkholderia ubonensis]
MIQHISEKDSVDWPCNKFHSASPYWRSAAHCLCSCLNKTQIIANLQDLIHIVNDLEARGVKFRSLKESVDTGGPAGKLVFHLFASLAEFERELVRERTLAGLDVARARGRKGGRPRALDPKQRKAALAMMRNRDMSIAEISRNFGVSRSTLYNIQSASREVLE